MKQTSIVPITVLNGDGLQPMFDLDRRMATTSERTQRSIVSHLGADLTVVAWEPSPATMDFARIGGHPFDQLIWVLNGRMKITHQNGPSYDFAEGDTFALPAGFRGTCDWTGGYRHLYVSTTQDLEAAFGPQRPEAPTTLKTPTLTDLLRSFVTPQPRHSDTNPHAVPIHPSAADNQDPSFTGAQITAALIAINELANNHRETFLQILSGTLTNHTPNDEPTTWKSGDFVLTKPESPGSLQPSEDFVALAIRPT